MTNPAVADEPAPSAAEPSAASILGPASLRTWFRVHCAIDLVAALPLLLFPQRILGLLGWTAIDPVATRLCGAALLGIGGASVLVDRHGLAGYRALLGLKVIWSWRRSSRSLAGIADGAPPAAWAFLSIFIAFSGDLDVVRDPAAPARALRVARCHAPTRTRPADPDERRVRAYSDDDSVDLRRRAGDAAGHRDHLGRHALDALHHVARLQQPLAQRRIDDQRGREHVDQLRRRPLRQHDLAQELAALRDRVGQVADQRAQRLIRVDELARLGRRQIRQLASPRSAGTADRSRARRRCARARARARPG